MRGSLSTLVGMMYYYSDNNHQDKADSINAVINQRFPDEIKMKESFSLLKSGDIEEAEKVFKTVTPNKFSSSYHNLKSTLHLRNNQLDSALTTIKSAVQLQRYKPSLLNNMAIIYNTMGDYEKALEVLYRGYRLHRNNFNILTGLTSTYFQLDNPDSVFFYATALTETDTGRADGYYYLTKISIQKRSNEEAKKYLRKYRIYGKFDPLFRQKMNELNELYKNSGLE
jgi:tetratricopeptide (TPR) repeat protein